MSEYFPLQVKKPRLIGSVIACSGRIRKIMCRIQNMYASSDSIIAITGIASKWIFIRKMLWIDFLGVELLYMLKMNSKSRNDKRVNLEEA